MGSILCARASSKSKDLLVADKCSYKLSSRFLKAIFMELFFESLRAIIPAAFIGGWYLLAFSLGLLSLVVVLVGSAATARFSPSIRLGAILALITVGSALSVAFSGRILYSDHELLSNPFLRNSDDGSSSSSGVISQAFTLAVLILASFEWFRWFTRQIKLEPKVRTIWALMVIYFVTSVVLSGWHGIIRNPRLNDLYAPYVLTAIALLAKGCDAVAWRWLRWSLLAPAVGSLLAMAIMPRLALEPDYASFLPGVNFRLHGLADHANSLGIIAAIGLLLELSSFVLARPSLLFLSVHLTVLLLAQSKAAWISVILSLAFVRWNWFRDDVMRGDRWRAKIILILSMLVIATIILIGFGYGIYSSRFLRVLDDSSIFTLTGRFEIWGLTLKEFVASPLLGYGPSLWDLTYRRERGMMHVGQAHGQFIQILGQAGVLGFLSLFAYLFSMARVTAIRWESSKGLAFILVFTLLLRCVAESPVRMGGIMGFDNWSHMIAFVAAVGAAAVAKNSNANLVMANKIPKASRAALA